MLGALDPAADAAELAAFRPSCKQHGGTLSLTGSDLDYNASVVDSSGEHCMITYRGTACAVAINADGTWDQETSDWNKTTCDSDILGTAVWARRYRRVRRPSESVTQQRGVGVAVDAVSGVAHRFRCVRRR